MSTGEFGIGIFPDTDYSVAGSGIAGFDVSVDPAVVMNDGGWFFVVTNTAQFGADRYAVHLGPAGDSSDPVCYPGVAGEGRFADVINGKYLELYSPIVIQGVGYFLTFVDELGNEDPSDDPVLDVVAHVERNRIYSMRRLMPPKWFTSARKVKDDPYPQL